MTITKTADALRAETLAEDAAEMLIEHYAATNNSVILTLSEDRFRGDLRSRWLELHWAERHYTDEAEERLEADADLIDWGAVARRVRPILEEIEAENLALCEAIDEERRIIIAEMRRDAMSLIGAF